MASFRVSYPKLPMAATLFAAGTMCHMPDSSCTFSAVEPVITYALTSLEKVPPEITGSSAPAALATDQAVPAKVPPVMVSLPTSLVEALEPQLTTA